jgi:Dyp-type peroxidase family
MNPVNLGKPLAWKRATEAAGVMLNELQANILTPHARDEMSILFLEFTERDRARGFLRALAPLVKSAATHLRELEPYRDVARERQLPASTYVGVGLSKAGYDALGVAAREQPADRAFQAGMKAPASLVALADPPVNSWEECYRGSIHAVVLIGAGTSRGSEAARELVDAAEQQVRAVLGDGAKVVGVERGTGRRNFAGQGIEHFGYVDGISQPLFLEEDVKAAGYKRLKVRGTALEKILVEDRGIKPPIEYPDVFFGSYLVFRKLEQNVRRFKQAEQDLRRKLGLGEAEEKRPGALVVGRFEDGTPIATSRSDGKGTDTRINDFDYGGDFLGKKCPTSAHIRRMNPRNEEHIPLARRGQTYGERADDPTDRSIPPEDRPEEGVGLLFMAFNASNDRQYVEVQRRFANDALDSGSDPLIGQGNFQRSYKYNQTWGRSRPSFECDFPQTVTMKGGEYFFTPSLGFLRAL